MPLLKKLRRVISGAATRAINSITGGGPAQELNTDHEGRIPEELCFRSAELEALLRRAGAEGCVLLKNDGALPLETTDSVAVLGRCQYDWFYVGYGSGGDVRAPYFVNLIDGLKNAGASYYEPLAEEYAGLCSSEKYRAEKGFWGHWPFSHPEVPIEEGFIKKAASLCRTALVVIGRAAGEDRDNVPEKGSWFLTDAERALLDTAVNSFGRVVVILNIGGLMDLSWVEDYGERLSAVLIAWLGGQESGNAVCDVLYGRVNPSGRLPMTSARRLEDWPSNPNFGKKDRTEYAEGVFMGYRYFEKYAPEAVLFPFGHGLSYTSFELCGLEAARGGSGVCVSFTVKNTGARAGGCSVPLFVRLPEGRLEKPLRVMCAFGRTSELEPGGEEELRLSFGIKQLASFDEAAHAFVLEPGEYRFEAEGTELGSITVTELETVEKCLPICIPSDELRERIEAGLPAELPGYAGEAPVLSQVLAGEVSLEDFVSSLSPEELEGLTRGHGMLNSPLGAPGNAGVFGGVTEALQRRGVPALTCCDGPAGLRMRRLCALIPCGTAIAASFDAELACRLHRLLGLEMKHFGVDVRLAPGMNLHRHPLCGRNFEYFSEDPTLSGLMAAAEVKGLKLSGRAACPKHFACNDQEAWRTVNDSVVSERALRELYLRNFELCVKESRPLFIMTSYNKINGVWAHYNYDLVTTVLRGEWGFEGAVMTDWWMKKARSPEFPLLKDNAYRVRAGVDVLMPGDMGHVAKSYRSDGSLLHSLGRRGGITRAELQQTALRVLKAAIRLKG